MIFFLPSFSTRNFVDFGQSFVGKDWRHLEKPAWPLMQIQSELLVKATSFEWSLHERSAKHAENKTLQPLDIEPLYAVRFLPNKLLSKLDNCGQFSSTLYDAFCQTN